MTKTETILEKFKPLDITSGFRMLMLIDRNKNGKDRDRERSVRRITNGHIEFVEVLGKFLKMKETPEFASWRIYSCVNDRNINKAMRIFKRNQLEADYYDEDSKNDFYIDIKNRWLSAFMQSQAKNTNYFLLDVDTKDKETIEDIEIKLSKVASFHVNYETILTLKYETKNGYHFITRPFDPRMLPDIQIKKDGLLLLDY